MAVRIRLTRVGATKRPSYRVVAIDSRRPRDGRSLEILGFYDPLTNPVTVQIDTDRVNAWIAKGARPSDTVGKLIRIAVEGPRPAVVPEKAPPKAKAAAKTPRTRKTPAKAEAAAAEAAPAETEAAAKAAPAEDAPIVEPVAEAEAASTDEAPAQTDDAASTGDAATTEEAATTDEAAATDETEKAAE